MTKKQRQAINREAWRRAKTECPRKPNELADSHSARLWGRWSVIRDALLREAEANGDDCSLARPM